MKILIVVGTRPNFVKAGPLLHEAARHPQIETVLVHTGQHYDEPMSRALLRDLDLPEPAIDLAAGSGSHAEQTAKVLMRLEPVLVEHAPHLVVVFGDVNSTLAAALTAAKLRIPIAHVEAGLRSFDRDMPEETNRVLTDALADYLFTPSREANANLLREGVPAAKIHFVGNVMADALLAALDRARASEPWLRWGLSPGSYGVVTLHRPANVDEAATLTALLAAIRDLSRRLPMIFPVHPRTQKRLTGLGLDSLLEQATGLVRTGPLGYLEFLGLLAASRLVLTDSGGIQAETSILEVPCLTLRQTTEWPVTLEEGTNTLVGSEPPRILGEAERIIAGEPSQGKRPELWDGSTAERIVEVLLRSA